MPIIAVVLCCDIDAWSSAIVVIMNIDVQRDNVKLCLDTIIITEFVKITIVVKSNTILGKVGMMNEQELVVGGIAIVRYGINIIWKFQREK